MPKRKLPLSRKQKQNLKQFLPLLITIMVFGLVFLFGTKAALRPNLAKLINPKQTDLGINYSGLKLAISGPCKGLYELISVAGGCTHGPDPVNMVAQSLAGRLSSSALAAGTVPCIGDGVSGSRVEVIYAHAVDVPDRTLTDSTLITTLRNTAATSNDIFVNSGLETGRAANLRFVTDASCNIVVHDVALTSVGDDNLDNTVTELKAAGYNRNDRKYLIYVDLGGHPVVYCGIGYLYPDDRSSSLNNNNSFVGYARVDNFGKRSDGSTLNCWTGFVGAHELMHNLGGVQSTSPHHSLHGHCVDEWEVECYNDAGPGESQTMTFPCASTHQSLFDCNHDDYFNTGTVTTTNYLATHWNTANNSALVYDTTPPTAPVLSGAASAASVVNLSWSASQDDFALAGYDIFRNGAKLARVTTTSYQDSGLKAQTAYTYVVKAIDTSGNLGTSNSLTLNTLAMAAPTNFRATSTTTTSVALAWDASSDPAILSYALTRNAQPIGAAGSITGTTYQEGGLAPSTLYTYTVQAKDSGGNLSAVVGLDITTRPDTTPPSAPGNFRSSAQTDHSISLSWNSSSDDVGVVGYRLYRGGSLIANLASGSTSYTDQNLNILTTYNYSIEAYDAAGNVSPRSSTSATTKIACFVFCI